MKICLPLLTSTTHSLAFRVDSQAYCVWSFGSWFSALHQTGVRSVFDTTLGELGALSMAEAFLNEFFIRGLRLCPDSMCRFKRKVLRRWWITPERVAEH